VTYEQPSVGVFLSFDRIDASARSAAELVQCGLTFRGSPGLARVKAFDAQGASLGVKSASGLGDIELTSPQLYGDAAISRFVLLATGDQIRLGRVLLPEPGGAGAAALLALAGLREVRRVRWIRARPAARRS
jgi:hypothetical protein